MLIFTACKTSQQMEAGSLGLPGDNLNLYAVLKIFQESPTLESFERSLNDSSSKINNLDLNGDNKTDYIRVIDSVQGNVHNIILRAVLGKGEEQNVAVIIVEKTKDSAVDVQIVGDEDLYGKDYIIEPNYKNSQAETPNPAYNKNVEYDSNLAPVETTPYEIASWPIISWMYMPAYMPWYSPWNWDYYPVYWSPWVPYYWHYYYGYHYYWNYYYFGHYHRSHVYRTPGWRDHYYSDAPIRTRSATFRQRVTRGEFRSNYSRPQDAQNGALFFRRSFPKAPSVNRELPRFRNNGAPVIKRKDNFNTIQPHQIKSGQRNQPSRPSAKQPATKPPRQPSKKNGND